MYIYCTYRGILSPTGHAQEKFEKCIRSADHTFHVNLCTHAHTHTYRHIRTMCFRQRCCFQLDFTRCYENRSECTYACMHIGICACVCLTSHTSCEVACAVLESEAVNIGGMLRKSSSGHYTEAMNLEKLDQETQSSRSKPNHY